MLWQKAVNIIIKFKNISRIDIGGFKLTLKLFFRGKKCSMFSILKIQ